MKMNKAYQSFTIAYIIAWFITALASSAIYVLNSDNSMIVRVFNPLTLQLLILILYTLELGRFPNHLKKHHSNHWQKLVKYWRWNSMRFSWIFSNDNEDLLEEIIIARNKHASMIVIIGITFIVNIPMGLMMISILKGILLA